MDSERQVGGRDLRFNVVSNEDQHLFWDCSRHVGLQELHVPPERTPYMYKYNMLIKLCIYISIFRIYAMYTCPGYCSCTCTCTCGKLNLNSSCVIRLSEIEITAHQTKCTVGIEIQHRNRFILRVYN